MLEEYEKLIPGYAEERGISIEKATRLCETTSLLMERMMQVGAAYAEFPESGDELFFCSILFMLFGRVKDGLVQDMMDYFYKGYTAHLKQKEETPHEETEHPAEAH